MKLNYYYIYDKKTGEIYHRYLTKTVKNRLLRVGKLMGLKIKAKREIRVYGEKNE